MDLSYYPMLHFRFYLLTSFIASVNLCSGQSIEGIVKNSETAEVIPYASIYVTELQTGTTSDSLGHFILSNLTSNRLTLHVSSIGFLTRQLEINVKELKEEIMVSLEPGHVELTEVIVSVPKGKLTNENIFLVTKKSLNDLNRNAQNSLAESISQLAGIDQISTGTSIGKPVIRGLSGNRVVTFAQGIRIENQQWGTEHGLGIGSVGIGGLEVIKGPNSILYGADAIGGVLYFTDEPYAKMNTVEGNVQSTFLSNSLSGQNSLGLKIHQGRYKQNIFASFNNSSDYQVPDGNRVVNTRSEEKSIKTSLGYNNKFWVSNLRYSFLNENPGVTESDSLYHNSTDKNPEPPFQKITNHIISSENVFYLKKSRIELILGYMVNHREEYELSVDTVSLDMKLATSTYNVKYHIPVGDEKNTLTIGAQGMYQTNSNSGEEVLIPDAITMDNGIFALWITSFEKLSIQGGLRIDQRNLEGLETRSGQNELFSAIDRTYSNFNYSAGMHYKTGNTVWRLSLSSGFRAPNTSELLSKGKHEGTNRFEIGDPDLKSENANQIDFSFVYGNEHLEITVNPYINSVQNYIYLIPSDSVIDGSQVSYYTQTNALLYGGEISLHVHPHSIHWLHFETAYSTTTGFDSEKMPLAWMPANNFNSTLKAEFKGNHKFFVSDLFVQHVYKFDQNKTALNETPSDQYQIVSIGMIAKCKFEKSVLMFKSGINNLFNEEYTDHLSRLKVYGVAGMGRNIYAGIGYGF